MLADHNSLIVPATDTEVPVEEKKMEILAARDTEVSALQQLGLYDAWVKCTTCTLATVRMYPQGIPTGIPFKTQKAPRTRPKGP